MSSGRTRGAALLAAACVATLTRALDAQAGATVDLGVSRVQYAGFLPSAAFALTPALLVEGGGTALSLRGTLLVFQSGNTSLQGTVGASAVHRISGAWRAEVWGAGGGSSYAGFAGLWHALAGARVIRSAGRATVWADVSGGATSYGGRPHPVTAVGIGAGTSRDGVAVRVSGSHTRVGETVYTDLRAEARRSVIGLAILGEVGARIWSRGGGQGVYGEGSAAKRLGERWTLVLAGGRYPTDAARGTISGSYVSAALRIDVWSPRPVAPRPSTPAPSRSGSAPVRASGGESGPWLEVRAEASDVVRLLIHAANAASVEVAGDFTDWRPVSLAAVGDGIWEARIAIPRGPHRANIRLDGGPWLVPQGMRRAADDYGAEIGIFIVP